MESEWEWEWEWERRRVAKLGRQSSGGGTVVAQWWNLWFCEAVAHAICLGLLLNETDRLRMWILLGVSVGFMSR